MQSSMAAISDDVIIEILCRLPVKTLLRFRCVSKQFRSIIDDPDFIKRHLQNQNHHSLNRRLIVQGIITPGPFSVDLDSADNAFIPDPPFESRESGLFVIGSCDGLLAFSLYGDRRVCLWNISTRKHQVLPVFWSDFDTYDNVFDGFGYDVATDDYKWVRVISDRKSMTEVTVFSLKANSWGRIENYPPYHNYNVYGIGVLVGSSLNWNVRVIDIGESRVMAFDLKDEKFYELSLPDIADVAEAGAKAEFDIVLLEGFLCLCYFNSFENALDVWVMKEYGVKESWTRLFRLPEETLLRLGDRSIIAFACSKSSDKVLVYQDDGEVFWHELNKNKDETVESTKWPTYIRRATLYIDSLVSPKIIV